MSQFRSDYMKFHKTQYAPFVGGMGNGVEDAIILYCKDEVEGLYWEEEILNTFFVSFQNTSYEIHKRQILFDGNRIYCRTFVILENDQENYRIMTFDITSFYLPKYPNQLIRLNYQWQDYLLVRKNKRFEVYGGSGLKINDPIIIAEIQDPIGLEYLVRNEYLKQIKWAYQVERVETITQEFGHKIDKFYISFPFHPEEPLEMYFDITVNFTENKKSLSDGLVPSVKCWLASEQTCSIFEEEIRDHFKLTKERSQHLLKALLEEKYLIHAFGVDWYTVVVD